MSEEELEMYSLRKNTMYKSVMDTIVKIMNDPSHNMDLKLAAKDAFIKNQVK